MLRIIFTDSRKGVCSILLISQILHVSCLIVQGNSSGLSKNVSLEVTMQQYSGLWKYSNCYVRWLGLCKIISIHRNNFYCYAICFTIA